MNHLLNGGYTGGSGYGNSRPTRSGGLGPVGRDPAPYIVDANDPYMGWHLGSDGGWLPPDYNTRASPPWAQGYDAYKTRDSLNANTPEGAAPLGDAWWANEWEGFVKQQEAQDRNTSAIAGLNDTSAQLTEMLGGYAQRADAAYDQFVNDPARQSVINNLMMRSDQDYSIYSDTERNALFNRVGQSIAQQRAIEQASNANRGISASGYSVQRDQDLVARGNADRLAIEANLAQGDEAAQQTAIGGLANSLVGFRQSDINAFGMSADIAGRLAGYQAALGMGAANIEAGYVEQPTDLLSGPMLDMAMSELRIMQKKAEAEGDFDAMDLITAILDLIQVQPLEEVMKFLAGILK